MSYDPAAENFALLKRTVIRTLDFTGRSSRTEVLLYGVACGIIGSVLQFAIESMFSWDASRYVGYALNTLFMLPFFALFARRMHDQDRTGWWTVLLPAILVLNIVTTSLGDNAPQFIPWVTVVLVIGYLVLLFLPGTDGPNRFDATPEIG